MIYAGLGFVFGLLLCFAVAALWVFYLGCDAAARCSCDRPECGGGCPL